MSNNAMNERVLEHLQALKEEARKSRAEIHEIRDELRIVKDHVLMLVQNDIDREGQQGTELARKVKALDN